MQKKLILISRSPCVGKTATGSRRRFVPMLHQITKCRTRMYWQPIHTSGKLKGQMVRLTYLTASLLLIGKIEQKRLLMVGNLQKAMIRLAICKYIMFLDWQFQNGIV